MMELRNCSNKNRVIKMSSHKRSIHIKMIKIMRRKRMKMLETMLDAILKVLNLPIIMMIKNKMKMKNKIKTIRLILLPQRT